MDSKHIKVKFNYCILIIFISILISCGRPELKPQFLFEIKLGMLPKEFKFWDHNIKVKDEFPLVYTHRIFYVANGERVFKLSPSGILLDYISNDPYFESIKSENILVRENQTLFNEERKMIYYPLDKVKKIAVDSDGRLLMINTNVVQENEDLYFKEKNDKYHNTLLYYKDGRVNNIVIQDGEGKIDGSVVGLDVIKDDFIFIVSREYSNFLLYLLDGSGRILRKLILDLSSYPKYTDTVKKSTLQDSNEENIDEEDIFGIVKSIVPSPNKNYAYVQYDYVGQVYNQYKDLTQLKTIDSKVFRIDLERGEFDKEINLPELYVDSSFSLKKVTNDGTLILVRYNSEDEERGTQDSNPTVLKISPQGKLKEEYTLLLPDVKIYAYNLYFDEEGNSTAYFVLKDRVEFFIWNQK